MPRVLICGGERAVLVKELKLNPRNQSSLVLLENSMEERKVGLDGEENT